MLWDYDKMHADLGQIREEYINSEKQKLREEVNNVVEYADYMISIREKRIRENLKNRIFEAYNLATQLLEKYKGKKSEKEIKQLIIESLRAIRFNEGRGYYFITKHDGTCILYTTHPEFEGQNINHFKDSKENSIVKDMSKISVEQGEGFYSYYWNKPNSLKTDNHKISYIKRLDFLDSFIGTGEYIEDMEKDIQKEILNRIAQIRFGADGYIFVVSYDGTTLMNGLQPELIGKNLWEMIDPYGVKVIQEERKAVQNPDGDFINYHWIKPSSRTISPKLSFIRGLPNWKWMVGAGTYTDEIEFLIKTKEEEHTNSIIANLKYLAIIFVLLLAGSQLLSYLISRNINKQIALFLKSFQNLEINDKQIDVDSFSLKELKIIAESANSMLQKRKQIEEENYENRERFRRIASNLPDMIYRMSLPDGKYEYVSPVSTRILGYEPNQFRKETFSLKNMLSDKWRKYFNEEWNKLLLGNMPPTYEYQIIHGKTGELRWIHQKNVLIKDENGRPIAIEGIVTDFTENKLVEEKRLNNELFLDSIIEQSPFAIWIADPTGMLLRANKALKKALNLKDEQLIGKYNVFEDPNVISQGLIPLIRSVFEEGKTVRFNAAWENEGLKGLYLPDTPSVHIDATMFPIMDSKGKIRNVVLYWIDISEQIRAKEEKKQLEMQLQQTQKMESIGRLAGGVAHDFNNMLTGITGNVQLAKMDLIDGDPLFETLTEIEIAAEKSAQLTKQLLAFSRQQIIVTKILDLNKLISEMHRMLVRIIGEDINLKTIPTKDLKLIKADYGTIEQVIMNLVLNARDAMKFGGKLTIETANVILDEEYLSKHPHVKPGEYVMLAVSDDGVGIPESDIPKVLDPFFTTKDSIERVGLGLSTVYGIVKQHNGHIELYSEQKVGTTVKIYLPTTEDKVNYVDVPKQLFSSEMPTGTETVFIVEDEAMVRKIAIKILTKLGYNVMYAENGKQALKTILKENVEIDLLLTDVIMPEMNGRELTEELKKNNKELKVIYTSGYTKEVIAQHGILEEGLNFIGKPYSPQLLAIKVRDVLDMP